MKTIAIFVGVILAAGLSGFFLGSLGNKIETVSVESLTLPSETEEKFNAIKEHIRPLAQVEYSEYLRLKNSEEKFAKADEMLGKMMLIFLADLGVRLTPHSENKAREAATSDQHKQATHRSSPTKSEVAKDPSPTETTEAAPKKLWIKYGKSITQERDLQEIDGLLEKAAAKNFGRELMESTKIRPKLFEKFVGSFYGQLRYLDKEKEPADIYLFVNGQIEKGLVTGENKFEMSRNGKVFSSSSGDGDIDKNFKSFNTLESDAFVVKVMPDTYLQLFENSAVGGFVGNVYQRTDISFTRSGTVKLERR